MKDEIGRQPSEDALQFGRENKVRQAADITRQIMTNLAIESMPNPVVIDADLTVTQVSERLWTATDKVVMGVGVTKKEAIDKYYEEIGRGL